MASESTSRARPIAALALIAGLVALLVFAPIDEWLVTAVQRLQEAGPAGALAFAVLYVFSTAAMLPASPLTLAAGFVYGPGWGFVLVWLSANAGAAVAFLLGRTLLRSTVEGWVQGRPRFAALDRAMGRDGLTLVTLLRMSPLFPFNVLNYALGLTQVRFTHYVAGSLVGMTPAVFLFVYLGSTLGELSQVFAGTSDTGTGGQALMVLGLVATFAATAVVTRSAKRALDEQLGTAAPSESPT